MQYYKTNIRAMVGNCKKKTKKRQQKKTKNQKEKSVRKEIFLVNSKSCYVVLNEKENSGVNLF